MFRTSLYRRPFFSEGDVSGTSGQGDGKTGNLRFANYSDAMEWMEMPAWGGDFQRWGRIIEGDSMQGPNSDDGLKEDDWAIFEDREPYPGVVVHAFKDGEDIIRVLHKGWLCPINQSYESIPLGDWQIKGVCMRRIRNKGQGVRDVREYASGLRWNFPALAETAAHALGTGTAEGKAQEPVSTEEKVFDEDSAYLEGAKRYGDPNEMTQSDRDVARFVAGARWQFDLLALSVPQLSGGVGELAKEMASWHKSVYPEPDSVMVPHIFKKAKEEFQEFVDDPCEEEAADVVMCLLAWLERSGFDAEKAIRRKLAALNDPNRNQRQRDKERGIEVATTPTHVREDQGGAE